MIVIKVLGRKATILHTVELPCGNDRSIPIQFVFDKNDALWANKKKIGVGLSVSPHGSSVAVPFDINANDEATVCGELLNISNAIVSLGVKAIEEDGSVITTNLVTIGKTIPGAGGEDVTINEMDISEQSAFDRFWKEIETGIRGDIGDLRSVVNAIIEGLGVQRSDS